MITSLLHAGDQFPAEAPNNTFKGPLCSRVFKMTVFEMQTYFPDRQELTPQGEFKLDWSKKSGRTKTLPSSPAEFPTSSWTTERWSVGNQSYRAVEVGFRSMDRDRTQLADDLLSAIQSFPTRNITVQLDAPLAEAFRLRDLFRWTIHQRVVDLYRGEKNSYLTDWLLSWLRADNYFNQNSDVIGVLAEPVSDLRRMTTAEIYNKLVATIQITYSGYQEPYNLFSPANFLDINNQRKELLFQGRMGNATRRVFMEQFWKDFDGRNVAEFGRRANFQSIPESLRARLMLTAIETAKLQGVDVVVFEVDSTSRRVFSIESLVNVGGRRVPAVHLYKDFPSIQNLMVNPKTGPYYLDQPNVPEFIMYIDLKSPEGQAYHQKLIEESRGVTTQVLPFR